MTKGLFYAHQGWTDVINCLPLINYYATKYDHLFVMVREDAKPIIDFYLKQFKNVSPYYVPKSELDAHTSLPPADTDVLYHGSYDVFRRDFFRGVFDRSNLYFAKRFYECYNISFMEKLNSFSLVRDLDLEEEKYLDFVQKYGEDYVLYHDDPNTPGGATGIDLNDVLFDVKNKVNLNGITNNVFDFIKVIENAKEIHLVDSIWAATCYLVDAKYSIFDKKNINLYPFKKRSGGLIQNHGDTKIEPYHPKNWMVKSI